MLVLAMGAVVLPAGSVLLAVLKIGIWAMGDTSDPAAVPARQEYISAISCFLRYGCLNVMASSL